MDGPTTSPGLLSLTHDWAAPGRTEAAPRVPSLSSPALEVLGALAPFGCSGPHRPDPLRRHTRLTPVAFQAALSELERFGLVRFEEEALWTTSTGESVSQAVFS